MDIRKIISAAKNNIPEAQYLLGCLYADEKHKKEKRRKKALWLLKAANQDYIPAMYELGKLYYRWTEEGVGIKDFPNSRDPHKECREQFIKWYKKAAQKGHLESQYELGNLYALGQVSYWTDQLTDEKHLNFDNKTAISYWKKAAQQGHPGAQFSLGWYYEQNHVRDNFLSLLISKLTNIFPFSLLPWAKSWQERYFFRSTIEQKQKACALYMLAAKQGNADAQRQLKGYSQKEG